MKTAFLLAVSVLAARAQAVWPCEIETARAALARLEAFRSANRPAEGDPIHRAVSADNSYGEGAAHVAAAEGRKLDAASFSLNSDSAGARPQSLERALPDFVVEDVSGRKGSRAEIKGNTVLLNIWATLEELNRTLKGRTDVAVVTLNADENPGLVKPFLDRAGYSFPVLLASEYGWKTLGVTAIPQNWIVDQAGVVRMDLAPLDRTSLAKQALPLFDKLRLDKLRPMQ